MVNVFDLILFNFNFINDPDIFSKFGRRSATFLFITDDKEDGQTDDEEDVAVLRCSNIFFVHLSSLIFCHLCHPEL